MLIWRRNLKINHYSVGVGPIDNGILYVAITGLVCIICPILLTIYGGEIYGSSDQAVLNVEAQYAKDSVLILYDTDDNLRLYSTSGAVGPSEVQVDCSVMSSAQKNGQIENEFDCSMSNVVAFELYNYFDLKMNGFSKSGDYVTQMIMTSSSSFRPSMKASLLSRVQLVQSNLALLPLDKGELSATNPFVPSAVDFWTPEEAIRNHTSRDLRFDQVHLIERWNGGETDSFVLNVKYEFPSVLASREEKLWTKVKAYFVQFMSFLIAFCFVFNKLNSYLFEANVFTSFTRMESIDRAKRG